jgi:hypothetical protein
MSVEKIDSQHRARKAVPYVRQSPAHQVQHNRESQGLQCAMSDRLVRLGWSQVEVIDEDLGCSAAGETLRAGFERMVAEVCLGKVGAVAAGRSLASRATAATGSSSWRCAGWSTRCSSIRRPFTHHAKATTGLFLGLKEA